MKKLIIEEDSIYEIDEECIRRKEKESKEMFQKKEEIRKKLDNQRKREKF